MLEMLKNTCLKDLLISGKSHGNIVIMSHYSHLCCCSKFITTIWGIYWFTFPHEIIAILLEYRQIP